MNTITVTPVFLPNGKDKQTGNLQYSIWFNLTPVISAPATSWKVDQSFLDAFHTFPAFLQDLQLSIVDASGKVLSGPFKPDPVDAAKYWAAFFTTDLLGVPWNASAPAPAGAGYTALNSTSQLDSFMNHHHVKRILDKNTLTGVFPAGSPEAKAINDYTTDIRGKCQDQNHAMENLCKTFRDGIKKIGHASRGGLAPKADPSTFALNDVLAHIRRHPLLLKQLGLLLDNFRHKLPVIKAADYGQGTGPVQLRVQRTNGASYTGVFQFAGSGAIFPTNVYQTASLFLAYSNTNTDIFQTGQLNLQPPQTGKPRFSLMQNTGAEVAYKHSRLAGAVAAGGDSSVLPPVHSNGFYLIDDQRNTISDYITKFANTPVGADGYYLEHLLIGMRFDLRMDTRPTWNNLNSGYEAYTVQGTQLPADPRELGGWTSFTSSAGTIDGGGLISEVLCHYKGWGLSSDNPLQYAAQQQKSQNTGISALHTYLKKIMQVNTHQPPGSLCPLRVGHSYTMQARLVTIDGYSIRPEESAVTLSTASTPYYRLDAVSPAVLVPREPLYTVDANCKQTAIPEKTGESAYTLVIRSTQNGQPTTERSKRGLAPGAISWHIAEWLGAFDKSGTPDPDPGLIQKSAGYLPVYGDQSNSLNKPGTFLPNGDPRILVPYIADPWACGFEIICKDHPELTKQFATEKDMKFWDAYKFSSIGTWDLVVIEQGSPTLPTPVPPGTAGIDVQEYNKRIVFYIPKGLTRNFILRCFPVNAGVFMQGNRNVNSIASGAAGKLPGTSSKANFSQKVLTAFTQNYPATDSKSHALRNVNLFSEMAFKIVHAVKTPLKNPAFNGPLQVARTWGPAERTYAMLSGTMFYPGATAARMVLFASWTDFNDVDGANQRKPYTGIRVGEFVLNGQVHKNLCGTVPANDLRVLGAVIAGPGAVPMVDGPLLLQILQNFKDTRHRVVSYTLGAVSAFTDYFPAQGAKEADFSAYSAPLAQVNIPSTQAPPPPKVAFIVPAFEWDVQHDSHTRKGNRLRVYLQRPWMVSGPDEQLAVVLCGTPSFSNEETYEQYVSKWGRDVITYDRNTISTNGPKNLQPLAPADFVGAGAVAGLTLNHPAFKTRSMTYGDGGCVASLQDVTNPIFQVVPINVEYDADLKMWYGDIVFTDPDAYCPFVQLALARYQKNSIGGEELSNTILCQFVQVAPTRSVTVKRDKGNLTVSLVAASAKFKPSGQTVVPKNEAYVRVIPREEVNGSDDGVLYAVYDGQMSKDKHGWAKMEYTVSGDTGVVWSYVLPIPDYDHVVLIKEFEGYDNPAVAGGSTDEDPTKRLVYGDFFL